ncbi:MAG: NACHT domain-containing protein [Glomeribacter sp. 1016415]|nr:NACHT domain-containing protein [Glomeribacter sp. 1016415]
MLWVPLRQLKTHSPKRLEDLLCNQYFVGHERRQAQALSKVFYAHQDKTLFILDGLDEVIGELDERSSLRDLVQNLLTQGECFILGANVIH